MNDPVANLTIRAARPADAARLIAYVQALANEPGIYIGLSPGEFDLTVEQEAQILADYAAAENSIYLVAEVGDQIVGNLDCRGGHRQSTRHCAILGMSVAKDWRGRGVGNLLLQHAVQWGRENPLVTRIELDVFVENSAAIRLYRKYGFAIEGLRRKAIYRDGRYHDDFCMALLL
jgi:RimJ/RimL family protein N-acetyltransferase